MSPKAVAIPTDIVLQELEPHAKARNKFFFFRTKENKGEGFDGLKLI